MTPSLRRQGWLFCAVALGTVATIVAGARLDPRLELFAVAALVLLLGVPHGSLDVVFARRLLRSASAGEWVAFSLGYVGLAALVVGLWLVAPTLFLCLFLALSALHFAGDPTAGVGRFARGLYGGAIIVLPALLHGAELEHLLGLVAGPASAAFVVPSLRALATPWLCAALLAGALEARTFPSDAMELIALAAVAVIVPPLPAFAIYFCAMHSPRHILRTIAGLERNAAREALATAVWPTGIVLATAVLVGLVADRIPLENRVMQLVFVGLAALTLPHMALLERVRRTVRAPECRPASGRA
jgi:Brp/Blh family beta-carotene 15,15'-monooxygenase